MTATARTGSGPACAPRPAVAALGLLVGLYGYAKFRAGLPHRVLWQQSLTIGPYLLAVLLLSRARLAARTVLLLILGVGIALQIIAMCTPPASSDDDYRYLWDAKVQLAGIDPYRYAGRRAGTGGLTHPVLLSGPRPHCAWPIEDGTACSAINRPEVRTVYPPVAEAAFGVVRLASLGGKGQHLPVQLAAALGAVAVAWLLARRALARGRPLWPVALWAWCPLVATEFGNNAHIDWLAVLLCVLALGSEAARRSGVAGLLIGAAIATKLYPGLVLMSLLRRRPVLVLSCAAGLVALSYLPHVLAIGPDVLGYLPGYLREERYTSGGRFLLLDPWLPYPAGPGRRRARPRRCGAVGAPAHRSGRAGGFRGRDGGRGDPGQHAVLRLVRAVAAGADGDVGRCRMAAGGDRAELVLPDRQRLPPGGELRLGPVRRGLAIPGLVRAAQPLARPVAGLRARAGSWHS